MSTTIKASCPVCGEVELTPPDMSLMVCKTDPDKSYYSFMCKTCNDEVRKPADEYVIDLLVSGNVEVTHWDIPAEALEQKAGDAIDYDDLIDFMNDLSAGDYLVGELHDD